MVVGNPNGMRELADQLSKHADRLRATPGKLKKTFHKIDMGGPWADDLEVVLKAHSKGYASAADRLDAAVKQLRSSATQVAAELEAERRREAAAAAAAELVRRQLVLKAEAARRASG